MIGASRRRNSLHRCLAQSLERALLEERGRCVWMDLPAGDPAGIARRLGGSALPSAAPAVADFLFFLPGGRAACLALGDLRSHANPPQEEFARRCERLGTPFAVARSVEEAEEILVEWGILLPREHLGPSTAAGPVRTRRPTT